MAKAPFRDLVKTRLKGYLSDEERLGLYTGVLETTIEKLRDIGGVNTKVAYTPKESKSYFLNFGLPVFCQTSGDLGERMFNSLQQVFKEGCRSAVLVGVDIPGLSAEIVLKAFALLGEYDTVFGPSRDGGYYLVGLNSPVREIFDGIEWSTERTLSQSIERAEKYGLKTALTEILRDIDTPEDLKEFNQTL
jgi:rSAM/selenodomain-associated transferase 1